MNEPAAAPRAVHLRPVFLATVWAGGAAGTAARYLLGRAVPHLRQMPVATLGVNLVGALVLGVLLEALARRGPDLGRRRTLRLLLGTGFLGGFTTYSALAVDTVSLTRTGLVGSAAVYALATIVLGGLGSFLGIVLAARQRRVAPT